MTLRRLSRLGLVLLGLAGLAVVGVVAGVTPRPAAPTDNDGQTMVVERYFTCSETTCRAYESPPTGTVDADAAYVTSGEIDLTGDGLPETVRRAGTQVTVEQDGAEAWRSPPHWDVVDVALGDPNDDGRGEILLAFWRENDDGIRGSHPFIIGYREGRYRTLWGGSAVADPIDAVALGDVDGDRAEEIIVLEQSGTKRAVTVWQWHGWGFSLVWRSAPDAYRDLVVLSGEGDAPDTIKVSVGEGVTENGAAVDH